ncbi:MAG: T9SS type A sorting domain-containing protein, partial [Bacteroidales bacterium]|nr:T9SS type A sorting domain-containing protein [Bacteroidales bacterium]
IYSVNGQMLSQQNINEGINTIDLSNLNAGMYFISVDETMVKIVKR